MSNEYFNQFNDSSKASFETFQQFNVINIEALQKLAALQFSLANLTVDSTVKQASLFTNGSAPQEILAAESELAKAYGEQLMQISNETTAVLSDSRERLLAFAEKTFQAVKPVAAPAQTKKAPGKKTATKKAVKKAA